MMKKLAERLKSPVVWGAVIITVQDRLSILESIGFSPRNIAVAVCMVLLALLAAINNPADRDGI